MATNVATKKLHTLKVSHFTAEQQLTTVRDVDTLETVVKTLSDAKIHSCPVVDENGVCVGVIDMLDIVVHALNVAPAAPTAAVVVTRWDGNVKLALETAARALSLETAAKIMNSSGKNNYVPIQEDNEATLAVDVFAKGIHRAPLLNREGALVGSLSQSTLLRWLIEESKSYLKDWPALELYLADLGLGAASVVTVRDTDSVVHVLAALAAAGVSAVPIVDADGKLIGNFSATDLVGLYSEKLPDFEQTVVGYLKAHSPQSLNSASLIGNHTTLKDVLAFFDANPYHRVWITESGKPIGVVSQTDIMAFLHDRDDDLVIAQ